MWQVAHELNAIGWWPLSPMRARIEALHGVNISVTPELLMVLPFVKKIVTKLKTLPVYPGMCTRIMILILLIMAIIRILEVLPPSRRSSPNSRRSQCTQVGAPA